MASASRKNIAHAIRQGLRGTNTTRRGSMVRVANALASEFQNEWKTHKGYSTWVISSWKEELDPTWVWECTGKGFFGVNPKAFESMMN